MARNDLIIDPSWDTRTVRLKSGSQTIYVKKFVGLDQAVEFCKPHWTKLHDTASELFVGQSSAPPIYSREQIEQFSRSGLWPEEEPFFCEVVYIRSIPFEEVLAFVDLHSFGEAALRPGVRVPVKQLLREIYDMAKFKFEALHSLGITGVFAKKPNPTMFRCIHKKVSSFNANFFPMEFSAEFWRKIDRQSNGFSIGPG